MFIIHAFFVGTLERVQERDSLVRESWVRAMEARIVQQTLEKCYRLEGVNHNENCKQLAERYALMLKENRVSPLNPYDVLFFPHPLNSVFPFLWLVGQRL